MTSFEASASVSASASLSASAGFSASASLSLGAGGSAGGGAGSEFLTTFNFEVHITASGLGGDDGLVADTRGAFAEVSGLEFNLEMQAIREGGYHLGARQLPGKTTHPAIVLKRGVTLDGAFWQWIQRCTDGTYPMPYVSGEILQFPPGEDRDAATPAKWSFTNGIVTKVKSADFNAASASNVPIEELHIAHEGLQRTQ